jgi:hypothetical protein
MTAVLSVSRPTTFQFIRQPQKTIVPESRAPGAGFPQFLCGGGLIVYGLLRGSWPGLMLAAAGGFLFYKGLTASPVAPMDRGPLPKDKLQAGAGRARSPSVVLPPVESETRLGQDLEKAADSTAPSPPPISPGPALVRGEELTTEEHAEAEVGAYYHALHRGGGLLPPY